MGIHEMPETPTPILALHPAATTAAALLSRSKDLIERYSSLCEHVGSKAEQRLGEQDSERDVTLLKAVISQRESHISCQLQRLLSEAKGQSKGAPPAPITPGEGGRTWDDLMEVPERPRSTVHDADVATWGMAARQAKTAMKQVVKNLPEG